MIFGFFRKGKGKTPQNKQPTLKPKPPEPPKEHFYKLHGEREGRMYGALASLGANKSKAETIVGLYKAAIENAATAEDPAVVRRVYEKMVIEFLGRKDAASFFEEFLPPK